MNIFVLYFFIISTVSLIRSEIIIFENSHRKLPHNIEDRYILLQKIYNDCIYCPYGGAWKDKQVAQDSREIKKKAEIEKQELFSNMIKNIAKNKDSKELMTLFKNAFIISAEDKETTFNAITQKIPLYNGNIKASQQMYNGEYCNQLRNLIYPNIEYTEKKQNDFLQSSPIVFPATLTPCFSYDPIRLEGPIKKPDIGIIFCNGVNFETKDTADFKKFNNDLVQLEKHIRKIAHCIVQAAYQLTKKANKTICNLKIPKIGLGQFAKKYQNKKALILCYLHNIQIALYSNSKKNIKWDIEFFNFDDDNVYKENWNNYFKDKNNENCRYTLNDKNISIFQKTKQIDNDTLTVIAHAGDQHSFLGNGCYNDHSAERFLAGYQNFDYLTPVHLLNLFLADIAFTDEEIINLSQSNDKLEIERTYPTKPIIPVDNKENIYLSKINTHYIIGGGILLTLCLATLWIHYKTDFFKDIINQSTNPVQKLEKK